MQDLTPLAHSNGANQQQLSAIHTTEGPLLIIAGPGSGKTFTLVERIVHLITTQNIRPESLLVVTFTTKAARELTTRIASRLTALTIPFNLNEMYLGTFHSICLRLLEEHREFTRLRRSFTMLDQFDQQFFVYRKLWEYRKIPGYELVVGARLSPWRQSEVVMKWVNRISEETMDVHALSEAAEPRVRVLAACFRLYQQHLYEANALDYTGIQYEAYHLLQTHPQVQEKLRSTISHIMVDEYQDTNTIQEQILKLLTNDQQNICVVGDDDQGLYRFRGATIRNILEFPAQFPEGRCKQITLTTNYRSTPEIISFYNQWMQGQKWNLGEKRFRFRKTIEPRQHDFPEVASVIKVTVAEDGNWNEELLYFLLRLKKSGQLRDWNQVAFLFRSVKSREVVALAGYLESHGIPVYSPRSNMFFQREEVRLMIGALIFLFPQYQYVRKWGITAELPVWEYYDNDCYKPFREELRNTAHSSLLNWVSELALQHLRLRQNTDYAFSGLFYQLLQFPLFSRFLTDEALQGVDKGRAARNLAMISSMLAKFEYLHHVKQLSPGSLTRNLRDLFNQFMRFMKDGGIEEHEDSTDVAPSGCVSFMTVHQAKGLEFPIVIVGSLGAVPQKSYSDLDEILEYNYQARPPFEPLEEIKYYDYRRLYYTAFSRAQNLLVLTCKDQAGKTPSRYFADMLYYLPHWRDHTFQPELMTFEPVKKVNIKREYSFTSHITVYENCPRQYRFFKELEFTPVKVTPMMFGTLVHQTIEDMHKAVLRGEAQKISPARITQWFNDNYMQLSKKEQTYLAHSTRKAAIGHVLRYFWRECAQWGNLQHAEVGLSLLRSDYILKGSVDLIRGAGDSVEIIDFKTEKKPDHRDQKRLNRYQRQLEIYAHLVEERTNKQVSRMHLYFTGETDDPYITFRKRSGAISKTIAAFDEIVSRIEQKDFRQELQPAKLCHDCDMRLLCGTGSTSDQCNR